MRRPGTAARRGIPVSGPGLRVEELGPDCRVEELGPDCVSRSWARIAVSRSALSAGRRGPSQDLAPARGCVPRLPGVAQGVEGRLGPRTQPELAEDPAHMVLAVFGLMKSRSAIAWFESPSA